MVAGAYALFEYTGIERETKDLDLMLSRDQVEPAMRALAGSGFHTEMLDPVWIAKAYSGESYIDLIFASSNGLVPVESEWFDRAPLARVLGYPCRIVPVEEMIWSKGYVNGRERYDGADVNHLILSLGEQLDWEHLVERFGAHWEVLLSHLVLFGFVYPGEKGRVPRWVMRELCSRLLKRQRATGMDRVCRGSLVSASAYQFDYETLGYLPEASSPHPDPHPEEERSGRKVAGRG